MDDDETLKCWSWHNKIIIVLLISSPSLWEALYNGGWFHLSIFRSHQVSGIVPLTYIIHLFISWRSNSNVHDELLVFIQDFFDSYLMMTKAFRHPPSRCSRQIGSHPQLESYLICGGENPSRKDEKITEKVQRNDTDQSIKNVMEPRIITCFN